LEIKRKSLNSNQSDEFVCFQQQKKRVNMCKHIYIKHSKHSKARHQHLPAMAIFPCDWNVHQPEHRIGVAWMHPGVVSKATPMTQVENG
jgi:hypothetical protein